MRMIRLSAAAAALFMSAQAALAGMVTVETAAGPVDVPAQPEKVIVFDIAALDTLTALGVRATGVPNRVYVDYLQEAAQAAAPAGSLFEPDFERVNAVAPDLIIAGGRSSAQVDALSALAPTIDMTIWGDGLLTQAKARLDAYGQIFGKEDEAKALTGKLDAAVAALRTRTSGAGKALIVLTNGPKISVYGLGSRFGWLHSELGIEPALQEVKASTHGEAVSFEFIRDTDPDWLIVIDRAAAIGEDASLASETLNNRLVAETKAWTSGQVIYLNAAKVYIASGGYRSVMDTVDDLSKAFSKTN